MTLTVDDRELIERLTQWFDSTAGLSEADGVDPAAFMELVGKGAANLLTEMPRLQSLLSERDKLAKALCDIADESNGLDAWNSIPIVARMRETARAALIQTEVP